MASIFACGQNAASARVGGKGDRMGRLILVRHGESAGNVTRVFTTTPMTLPLTELGRKQAREVASAILAISNPRVVVASPYVRARDTGAIIAEQLKLPFEVREGLHERETGEFAGKPYESIFEAEGYDHTRPWTWSRRAVNPTNTSVTESDPFSTNWSHASPMTT